MSSNHFPEHQPPIATESMAPQAFAGAVLGHLPAPSRGHRRVPDAIERRYLRVDNRYFFPDRTLAFIDDGGSIRVRTENHEVLNGVAAIAQARDWKVIELEGTEAFRRGMWREAVLRGIEVRGYAPTPAEVLQMQRASERARLTQERARDAALTSADREAAAARAAPTPAESERPSDHRAPEAPQEAPSASRRVSAPVRGVLLAAAAAPYQFDPAQRMSFYVMVRTEAGDRTIWGVDLERALAESASQPRIGGQVVLMHHGTQQVHVRAAARNANGEFVDEGRVPLQRGRWSVETPDHLRAMEQRAERVRNIEFLSDEMRQRDPELATAAADLKLAEQYARRVTGDPDSQQRLVQLIRERMADALGQGRAIRLPDLRLHPGSLMRQRTPSLREEELYHERV